MAHHCQYDLEYWQYWNGGTAANLSILRGTMTAKERMNKDLLEALDRVPEIMIGLQQMLKAVHENELDYDKMDEYTSMYRAIKMIEIAHVHTSQRNIDHVVESYSIEDQEDDNYPDYDEIEGYREMKTISYYDDVMGMEVVKSVRI